MTLKAVILGIGRMGLALIMVSAGVQVIPAAEAGLVSRLATVLAPARLMVGESPGADGSLRGAIVMARVLGRVLMGR